MIITLGEKRWSKMTIITKDEERLIQRVLDLANLRDMRSAQRVERLFKNHPLVKKFPLWRTVYPTDIKGFTDMRSNLRRWLDTIMNGTEKQRGAIRDKIVTAFQRDCADTAEIAGKIAFKTWGVPILAIDGKGHLNFGAVPLLTGVHACVWFGLVLMFASDRTKKIAKCNASYSGGEPCGNYFIKSRKLRIACSATCKRRLRHAQIYKYVKNIRQERTSK